MAGPQLPRALYLHVPFCERKCPYCDFASIAGRADEAVYMDALRAEIARIGAAIGPCEIDTVFVGGGTPSFVDPRELVRTLEEAARAFSLADGAEITLEANPSSITPDRLRAWRDGGFNRISIGVQSLNDDMLRFLGRVHDSAQAAAAVAAARAAFDSVSCDLIYAVPGLEMERWRATLDTVLRLGPDHISCYELTVEEGTPLHVRVSRGEVRPVAAEAALSQHWEAADRLTAGGLLQYEVSNFARPGMESRHNLTYWRNQPYLAAGVGAHGHLDAQTAATLGWRGDVGDNFVRFWHHRGVAGYLRAASEAPGWQDWESVSAAAHRAETVLVGLRLREGVALELVDGPRLAALEAAGLVERNGARVRTTRRGEELLNQVALELTAAAPNGDFAASGVVPV